MRGDTTGAPSTCSAAAGIAKLSAWFAAFQRADSLGLADAIAVRDSTPWVFSTGKFTRADRFVRIDSLSALLGYARSRARHHERLRVDSVRFTGWRERRLGFLPYYMRTADDLGAIPLQGIGKGALVCTGRVLVLNLAPGGDPVRAVGR